MITHGLLSPELARDRVRTAELNARLSQLPANVTAARRWRWIGHRLEKLRAAVQRR